MFCDLRELISVESRATEYVTSSFILDILSSLISIAITSAPFFESLVAIAEPNRPIPITAKRSLLFITITVSIF